VTRAERAGCKTVGSAYVGSNPTPATTCGNGPLAGISRLGGPFFLCPVVCHLGPEHEPPYEPEHRKGCAQLVFPNLITHVATTGATVTGNQMTGAIHDDLAARNLLPGRHYLDSGYLSAALVVAEAARHGVAPTGPLLAGTSARARAAGGYARADFTVRYGTRTVTCPQGKTSSSWTSCTQRGQAAAVATLERGVHATAACPGRASTTRSWPPRSTSCAWKPTGTAPR
jgi:hypothetical protein